MLSKKAKYGLKAMLHLARLERGQTAFVSAIAAENELPKKFLDAILAELRTAGMLNSKKGRNGGFALALRPEDISVGAIIRALDGPIAPLACAGRTGQTPCSDCRSAEECQIRAVMLDVGEAIAGVLDQRSLAEVRDVRGDTMANFVYQI